MATPRHRTAPGTSYFVTTKCWQGRQIFQVLEIAEILLQTLFYYRDQKAYQLHEFVLMPDHLHLLLTPSETTSLEKAVQLIKGGSSHRIHRERNHKMEIWQEGFYDWTIRDFEDWQAKVEYIRLNPVRAKLVVKPEEWPFSSTSGRFRLDSMPIKYLNVPSGAKAPVAPALTPGLKRRPPKEGAVPGPEGPTPSTIESELSPSSAIASGAKAPFEAALVPGLKPRPPKEQSSATGKHALDPIPQGLKPLIAQSPNVGPKGPTPKSAGPERSYVKLRTSGAKVPVAADSTRGLKPPPPKEETAPGPKGPTPGALANDQTTKSAVVKAAHS